MYADPSNVTSLKALILGTPDTPYEHGYFLFDIRVPEDYPHVPPKVKLVTLSGNVHFNPNMYRNGKVCLSILGTWKGPSWTCAMSINSLCVDIQSLFVPDPLTNEPGYSVREESTTYKYETYNAIIEHATMRVALLDMLRHSPPNGCDVFIPLMQQTFIKNATRIIALTDKRLEAHPEREKLHCDMWYNFTEVLEYDKLAASFRDLYDNMKLLIPPNEDEGNGDVGSTGTIDSPESTDTTDTTDTTNIHGVEELSDSTSVADVMTDPVDENADVTDENGGAGPQAEENEGNPIDQLQTDHAKGGADTCVLQTNIDSVHSPAVSNTPTLDTVVTEQPLQQQPQPQPTSIPSEPSPPPCKKKRVYYRRPGKNDANGRVCGDIIKVRQKDGVYIEFKLVAGKKDPNTRRWLRVNLGTK